MYCSYGEYLLLGGRMTEEQVAVYGPRAAARIDAMTMGRAERHAEALKAELSDANAAMADLLLSASGAAQAAASGLASASNDGYSESYRTSGEARRALDAALLDALRNALGSDPYNLLWQGVE